MAFPYERIGGEAPPHWVAEQMRRDADEEFETASEIEAARGAIQECIRKVEIQANGSRHDFRDTITGLEDLLSELRSER